MMIEQAEEMIGDSESGQTQDNGIESPGAYLAARRQALDWSIEQVADQIKLAPRQVLAIECDDYAALPSMVVTRGFIRSYAKCLKMDAAPLLAMLRSDAAPKINAIPLRRAIPVNFSEGRFPLMGNRNSVFSKWSIGVIFLILLLFSALLSQRMGWLPDLSKVTVASSINNRDKTIPGEIASAPEKEVKAPRPEVRKDDVAIPPVVMPVLASAPAPAPEPEPGGAPVVAVSATPNDVAEKNQLVLQAHQDSWIELKRANKSVAFSRILKAGEVEKFEMNEPVLLIIGNVAGVKVTLRGEPFNVKAGVNGNVARINLK